MVDHPFIVKLYYAFQTSKYFFLIQEFCPCGDLSKMLQKKKKIGEDEAKLYIAEVILALEFLHSQGIIYRDLKPDNIIIAEDGHLKLTDFGLSKENADSDFTSNSFVGTYAYAAPEVLKQKAHGKSLDWYLLGALLYELLVGLPPYYDKDQDVMNDNIINGALKLPRGLSEQARDIILKLLSRNPLNRLGAGPTGAKEIKTHPFFQGLNWDDIYNKKANLTFRIKKRVHRQEIPIESYIAAIGNCEENYSRNWSFIRE